MLNHERGRVKTTNNLLNKPKFAAKKQNWNNIEKNKEKISI